MTSEDNAPLCPDWLCLTNANVHVAKDRGWFKTYTPFPSTLNASPFFSPSTPPLPVLGIGTVIIPTKRSPNLSGTSSHSTLTLHEVLHVPASICNFIGLALMRTDGYECIMGGSGAKSKGAIKDSNGRNVAYFDPKCQLFGIKVRQAQDGQPPLGPHVLDKNVMYVLGVRWELEEVRRWEDFKARNGLAIDTPAQLDAKRGYTPEETAFLKNNYGNEFKFLVQYGLKMHDEEDREEGRAILRAVMREDAEDDESADDDYDDDDDGEDEFAEYEGHQADYNFSERQLEWIDKNYRNSEQFMLSYGLKFYDEEDIDEAKAIVDAIMG